MKYNFLIILFLFACQIVVAQKKFTPEQQKLLEDRAQLTQQIQQLQASGNFKDAISAVEKKLEIEKELLGGVHKIIVDTLFNLSELQLANGEETKAIKTKEQIVQLNTQLNGLNHWTTIDSKLALQDAVLFTRLPEKKLSELEKSKNMITLMVKLFKAEKYEQAMPLAEQAHKIQRDVFGEKHPHYATSLNNLATLYRSRGDYLKAETLHMEALEITKNVLGVKHPRYITNLNSLALLYRSMGNYPKAEPFYLQTATLHGEIFGKKNLGFATRLANLAFLYYKLGDYTKAESFYKQTLQVTKEVLGEKHIRYAKSLNDLAVVYQDMGDYFKAKNLYKQSLQIKKEILEEKHPDYSLSLNNLAGVYRVIGDYSKAEPLYRQALEIRKEVLGEKHPDYATSLNNLAFLYVKMGSYTKAESLYKQSLQIRKELLGEKHPDFAISLNNLASIYNSMGDYSKAESLQKQALEINKEILGEKHPDYALCLNNLAVLYDKMGEHAKAELLHKSSLRIKKEILGEKHPDIATILNNIAAVYNSQGKYTKAEPLYMQSLEIRREVLGEKHPDFAISLTGLASFNKEIGAYSKAEDLYMRALDISFKNLRDTASIQSERQQLEMTKSFFYRMHSFISLGIDYPKATRSIYDAWLSWKGAISLRQRQLRSMSKYPEFKETFSTLTTVTSLLTTLSFKTPNSNQRENWQKQLKLLSDKKEVLERELSLKSEEFRKAKKEVDLDQLQNSITSDSVLLDFVECWYSYKEESKSGLQFERRLAVFVVFKKQDPVLIDLGEIKPIHSAIDNWRQSFGTSTESQRAAKTLRERIWEPIAVHVKDTKMILVSPDGALGKFPLAALPGSNPGTYLIEEYPIAIIPSPRSLVDLQTEPNEKPTLQQMLLIGGVDYEQTGNQPVQLAGTRSIAWMDKPQFGFLPGAQEEVKKIEQLAGVYAPKSERITLTGKEANEEQFRLRAPQANYLHIATHGFFAPPEMKNALSSGDGKQQMMSFNQQKQQIQGFHPGLLSGLVFAGANNPKPDREDGIMTAEEVGTLNLENCELAVLSACETGLGQVAGGEGVLGLQRAFDIAGAKTTVTSLWKVHDQATRLLMERFYDNLWNKKMGKLEALREAQLWMLSGQSLKEAKARGLVELEQDAPKEGRLPPYYWAAFVLSGDWR